MNGPDGGRAHPLSISAVERDTGLSKDTLRVWERRYGFPTPARDALGERVYAQEQVRRLRIIKRLLDAGHRPGRVLTLPLDALECLSEAGAGASAQGVDTAPPAVLAEVVHLVRSHDVLGLRRQLGQALGRLGLSRFVLDVLAPLNTLVGDAWMRGQMEIFEEHAFTESVQVVLRGALCGLPEAAPHDRPQVLLSTLPGEPHGLGLLMAEALFAVDGAQCLSLGVQTPVWDIVLAAGAHRADLVGLSFTGCMNPNQVVEGLTELRAKLPPAVEIWAGGSAPVLHRRPVAGVTAMSALAEVHTGLQRWRGTHRPA